MFKSLVKEFPSQEACGRWLLIIDNPSTGANMATLKIYYIKQGFITICSRYDNFALAKPQKVDRVKTGNI
jgi:hypothetical protein